MQVFVSYGSVLIVLCSTAGEVPPITYVRTYVHKPCSDETLKD